MSNSYATPCLKGSLTPNTVTNIPKHILLVADIDGLFRAASNKTPVPD